VDNNADEDAVDDEDAVEALPLEVTEVRDGIRIFKGLKKKLAVQHGRKLYQALMYDRYSTYSLSSFLHQLNVPSGYAGYKGKGHMLDWTGITQGYDAMVNTAVVPTVEDSPGNIRPAKLRPANQMNKADLLAWFAFFAKQQDNDDQTVSWDDGMLFVPTALVEAIRTFDGKTSLPGH
jgi:hypothetical protein